MSEKGEAVLYSSDSEGVAEIRFNRPERLNVLDVETARGFRDAVDRALDDEAVRVILVTAQGKAFVAGGDLGYFRVTDDKRAAAADLIDPIHSALKRLSRSPKISLASLKGAVAGGGMSIALNLDLAVAADDCRFNLAYAAIGASPDCGGSWALPRLVGLRKALEIALLGETIGAEEARRLGLVSRVVSAAELDGETTALATRLAKGAPIAAGHIKDLLRSSLDRTFEAQLDAEAESFAACASTRDFSDAVEAFFEKRKPQFHGR
ncbi:MAG: enoyl-CoA hydratase-related protein [Mesorhizobium sp.]